MFKLITVGISYSRIHLNPSKITDIGYFSQSEGISLYKELLMRELKSSELKDVSGAGACGPSLGGFLLWLMTDKICCGGRCF